MIIRDRGNNIQEDINGGKLSFLGVTPQIDSAHQTDNDDAIGSDSAATRSVGFYAPCPKRPFDVRRLFAPVFQHCDGQTQDNDDTPTGNYAIEALQPSSHAVTRSNSKNPVTDDSSDSLQAGMMLAPTDVSRATESPPLFCSPAVYDQSLSSCISPTSTGDGEVKSGSGAHSEFSSGSGSRGAKVDISHKDIDEAARCIQRYACKHKDCGKSFTTSAHLSRHVKLHTGQRPHRCPLPGCKKEFARRDNMLVHYRTHAKKSGVESGPTMVSARRASSGSVPQGSGVGDPDALALRISQANLGDNYSLSTPLCQYNEMIRTRGQYSNAFCVGQSHPRAPCRYIPPSVSGDSDTFQGGALPQADVSNRGSHYDVRAFGSASQQIYGDMHDMQMETLSAADIKLSVQKCQRKQQVFRQRSHSETPAPCGPVRMHPGMMYRSIPPQMRYPPAKDACLDQKMESQQQDMMVPLPACFGAFDPQQQVPGLAAYYPVEKVQFEHLDTGVAACTADPLPAMIKSLITVNNTQNLRSEGPYCQHRSQKIRLLQETVPISGAANPAPRAFPRAAADVSV